MSSVFPDSFYCLIVQQKKEESQHSQVSLPQKPVLLAAFYIAARRTYGKEQRLTTCILTAPEHTSRACMRLGFWRFPHVPLRAAVSLIEFVFWYLYKTFPLWFTPSLKRSTWPHVNVYFYGSIISGLLNLHCLKAHSELKWKTQEVSDHLEVASVLVLRDFAASILAGIGP